jgi:CHAT domain-containing protein
MRSVIDGGLSSGLTEARQLASILNTNVSIVDARGTEFWEHLAEAEILHIVTHGEHNVLLPLDAALLIGESYLPLWAMLASLELPRCTVASNVVCETAFPAIRRAPGLDFASGLLAAGARNVLASTWVVRDDLASRFTCLFFEQWMKGIGPGAAYQSAFKKISAEVDFEFSWISIRLVGPTMS